MHPRQFPALVTIIAALPKQQEPGWASPENDRSKEVRFQ
jgi:hypothetical protein